MTRTARSRRAPRRLRRAWPVPGRSHPASRLALRALAAAGGAVAVAVLAACGAEQPTVAAAPQAPQTVAVVPGAQGVTLEINGDMDVISARIPAPAAGADTAQAEMTLADTDTAGPDVLRAASSPAARAVVFTSDGHAVTSITVPVAAGTSISTGPPYPDRIVLTGLRRPLRAGQTVTLTLVFARAGQVTLHVPVIPAVP